MLQGIADTVHGHSIKQRVEFLCAASVSIGPAQALHHEGLRTPEAFDPGGLTAQRAQRPQVETYRVPDRPLFRPLYRLLPVREGGLAQRINDVPRRVFCTIEQVTSGGKGQVKIDETLQRAKGVWEAAANRPGYTLPTEGLTVLGGWFVQLLRERGYQQMEELAGDAESCTTPPRPLFNGIAHARVGAE